MSDDFSVTGQGNGLRNADFRRARFKTAQYEKYSISYLAPLIWSTISQEVRKNSLLKVLKMPSGQKIYTQLKIVIKTKKILKN